MKFGDLAIFAKVGWEILEIRLRYSYLAPVSILFRLQTGAVGEARPHPHTQTVHGGLSREHWRAGQTLQCADAREHWRA